jgi:gamma-glutamylcyclotransferase (GGCT)/AIG2-like uncharacterized protein YtfP
MSPGPAAVFVYGTLMRGEQRAGMWPRPPLGVEPATIRAALYDLGPYPAITHGDDLVRGELWRLADADVTETLLALDQIECYGQGGVDLYIRRIVCCTTDCGETQPAHTYFIADPQTVNRGRRIPPGQEGWSHWRPGRD